MKKRILSLLLVLAFLLGLLPTMALAGESITATVQAAPSTVTVQFFTDEACEKPIDAAAVKANGVEGKYNTYTLTLPAGTYYYRGKDGSVDLGGGALVLTEAESQSVNLIRHNFYVNNTAFNTIGDYSLTGLKDTGKAEVVLGAAYVESNKVYTPALLIGGMTYDGGTISIAESKLDGYYPGTLSAFTPSATATAVQSKTLSVTAYKTFSLTAPTGAEVEFYNQTKNFVVSRMDRSETTETNNGDGTTTYAFKSKSTNYSGQYSFRVSKAGEATQAGFFQNGEAATVTFPQHGAAEAVSSAGLLGSDDRSVLLNVGSTGELHLTAGESFRLRAFRAPWEIVDSTTGNHMIEPDFHSSVLSGSDVVRVTPVTDTVTGNAAGNWMTVEALKEGTAVVAVWYDAIDVYTYDSKAKAFSPLTYGAADPARYGIFVVTVGEDHTVTWNPVSADGDWDAEFDTVHYTGESGVFTFKPVETLTDIIVTNVYGAQMGKAQTVTASGDGSYAVPVTEGANIIAASTAAGTDYFVVRAKKINVTVTNNTTGKTDADEDFTVTVGDSVTVSFDRIAMPVPKMSGIYNPGYLGTMKTAYTLNDTYSLSSKGAQYTYPDDSAITFTAYLPGENILTGGVTNMTSMGDPFGNHRNLTDEGRAANLNAQEVPGIFGTLPDVSFTVSENPEAKIDAESLTKLKSVSIYNGPSTYQCGVNINAVSASKDYSWTATNAAQMANWDFHFLVTAESYYNTIEARYWYEGEAVHKLNLTSGIAATVPASEFAGDASKMLNIQIVVTPADPTLGDAKTYSYVVLGGTASLQYVHPALRNLTVTDEAGTAIPLEPALSYTNTEYTLNVGSAQKLTLNGQQLQKYQNAANNAQDKSDTVTLTLLKSGSPVGESVTILPETEDRYPVGKWTLNDIGITEADAIQIAVKSYVNDLTRTYVIKLVKDVPAPVEPAEDAEILVTVSSKGVLAADKDGKVMVNRPVTVKDLNSDGVLTVEEALIAAHAAYLSDSGYASSATEYGISVTKLWNVDTYNTLFFVNGTALASGVGVDTVSAGDRLLASVNADDLYYSDWYTAFDAAEQRVKTLVPFTLKLTGCQGMAYPFDPTASVAGVQLGIWENGAFNAIEGAVTDETGSATLSFEKPGTYYVTAKGTVSDDVVTDWVNYTTEKKDCPVIAPVCVVTVEESEWIACGTDGNIDWTLSRDGILTVSKNTNASDGSMMDYDVDVPGWDPLCGEIKGVVVNDGVTSIGNFAFYQLAKAEYISLPESLTSIGSYAFNGMSNLRSLDVPASVTKLGGSSLSDCTSLSYLSIPGITAIGSGFWGLYACPRELVIGTGITTYSQFYNPEVLYYLGTKEQFDAISDTFAQLSGAIANGTMTLVCNADVNAVGTAPVITNQLPNITIRQSVDSAKLTVSVEKVEGASYLYYWIQKVNGTETMLKDNGAELAIPAGTAGKFEYTCCVRMVKDGKVDEAMTNSATVTVTAYTPADAFEGEGTEEAPFIISTVEELNTFANFVKGGEGFEGKFVQLGADITLPEGWTPIGCTKDGTYQLKSGANLNAFKGIFDGADHTVTVPKGGLPLFGYLWNATVKNLKVYGEQINGYGLVNNFEGVQLTSVITLDNITLVSGTKTLKSGLLGANLTVNSNAGNSTSAYAIVKNCTVEKGCVIGYDGQQNNIGSIAGDMQGIIENCVSYAEVKGMNYVGGIAASRDNSMGEVTIRNNAFHGTVAGTENVGGIVGGGYGNNTTAPNGFHLNVVGNSCDGIVSGTTNVGGIFGGDKYVAQSWQNGKNDFTGNTFTGTVSGTTNVGAIIGLYHSLNKWDNISGNTYAADCGAEKGIGMVEFVDTNCETIIAEFDEEAKNVTLDGTLYFNTENGTEGCPSVQGCGWKVAHNRTDDPLGADAEKLCRVFGSTPMDEPIDEPGDEPGTDISSDITIYFTLLGDTLHEETVKHTYAARNLITWMARTSYTVEANTTVSAFLDWLDAGDDRISIHNPGGNYIESITYGSVTLGEFDNTNVSGWMYLLNGTHPDKGVAEQRLSDGDELVLHFTDDYTMEQGSEQWNDPGTEPTENPETPISPITEPVQPSGKAKVQEYAAQNGKVPAIVNANGTKTVIKKAYQDGETVYALVPDGAKVEFIDNAKRFTDVKPGDWYAEATNFVTAHELFEGIGAGVFAPDMPMSRAMLLTVLYRLEDTPDFDVDAAFSDVLSGDWYADAVLWAAANEITNGMGNGSFGADKDVTREQIATFLYRYAKKLGLDVSASGSLETFPDGGKVSGWAQDAMKWAAGAGLFRGDNHGMLNPGKNATRAEVATLIMRMMELIVK